MISEEEKAKLKVVLSHLNIIRDKSVNLDSDLNSLISTVKDNLIVDDEGYKSDDIDDIETDVTDVINDINTDVGVSIKRKTEV